jgi:hypothetical protein
MAFALQQALRGRTRYTCYFRIYNRHSGAQFFRAEFEAKRSTGFVSPSWRYSVISVAEFDRQLDRNPGIVRPYMYAIGDHRRGQELLDSAHLDQQRETMANLQETPQGRQLLDNLARVMDETILAKLRALLAAIAPTSSCSLPDLRSTLEEAASTPASSSPSQAASTPPCSSPSQPASTSSSSPQPASSSDSPSLSRYPAQL